MSGPTPLRMEPLTARVTPSAVTAAFADGVLTVTGTDGADTIFVTQAVTRPTDAPRLAVNRTGSESDPGSSVPIAGGAPALADVRRVVVNAGNGDDFVSVSTFGLSAPVEVNGQGGNDYLPGGLATSGGRVALNGGAGDDYLMVTHDGVTADGGAGNNTVHDTRVGRLPGPADYTSAQASAAKALLDAIATAVAQQTAAAVGAKPPAGPSADAKPTVLPDDTEEAKPTAAVAPPAAVAPTRPASQPASEEGPVPEEVGSAAPSLVPTSAATPKPTGVLPGDIVA